MLHIPIVMATDDNYIPLVVALISLIENAAEDTFYDIYIITDNSFSKESAHAVKENLKEYAMHSSLIFKNVGNAFDHAFTNIPHITRPTYFRLLIPDLLKEDKCIYLDTDTIVMSDLQELFNISFDNCYIAGVWHPGIMMFDWEESIRKNAKIPSAEQYINAGVLVMNLGLMRKDKIVKQFLELVPQNMPSQDQDIINHVCYGKIVFLPFKYNVMTKLSDKCIGDYKGCCTEAELKEAWNEPCIIHFADRYKPWNSGSCVFMDYWWNYYRRSKLYECNLADFFDKFVMSIIYGLHRDLIFTKKLPMLFDISYKRRYVIYGAGKRAREVISFLREKKLSPEFIVVSDIVENPIDIDGMEVKSIEEVGQMLFDKSILIAVRESLHMEIINSLKGYHYRELLPVSDCAI